MPETRSLSTHILISSALFLSIGAIARAGPPSAPSPVYERIVQTYLDSKWDNLKADVSPANKDLAGLSDSEKADVAYIRQAVAECRPAWWDSCKAGKPTTLNPLVWGKTISARFDPTGKPGVSMQFNNGVPSASLNWNFADMDNPDEAEHGYSKGELADLGIWMQVGMAQTWASVPLDRLLGASEKQRLLLSRYLDLRGQATGCYYGTPRARRWGLWLCLASYEDKYAQMPIVMDRRATAAMFIQEIIAHRDRYPSIPLPDALPAEGTEDKLAEAIRDQIEHNPWTLAEDKAIREALKAFVASNGQEILQTGVAKLPSGLTVSLDIEADKPLKLKRDAWEKKTFDGGVK